MSAWPSRGGGLQRPLRGAEKMKTEQQHQVVRPCRSDSSQQASTKPGAVQTVMFNDRDGCAITGVVVRINQCTATIGTGTADGGAWRVPFHMLRHVLDI